MHDTVEILLNKYLSLQHEWIIAKKKAARGKSEKLKIAEAKAYNLFYESFKNLQNFNLSSRLPNTGLSSPPESSVSPSEQAIPNKPENKS